MDIKKHFILLASFRLSILGLFWSGFIQAQDQILLFVAHEDTYYSEFIVMKQALTDAGYVVDVRSASTSLPANTYMIPFNTTIEETAATLQGGSYLQFTNQYQAYFGQSWDPLLNNIPANLPTNGSILDVNNMSNYKGLVVVGGTGAQAYLVDGMYNSQGIGPRFISSDSVRMIAEKLNALAIDALTNGKPVMGQCHGAGIPAHWRYPIPNNAEPGNVGNSILLGSRATGFPEAATAATLTGLGISYRANDPVVIGTPNVNVSHENNGHFRILTTRDWYPQTVAHAARTLINIIESYPLYMETNDTINVLILHGGAVDPNNCLHTNRDNDIPCNYGNQPLNLPADYTDLVTLLSANSNVDDYQFLVSDAHLTVNTPFDNQDFCSVYRYLSQFDVIFFYKHWSTGVTNPLQEALVAFADNGGGVIAMHHGLYNDIDGSGLNKNILVNQLFQAESAMNTWSANRTTYTLFNTNYGNFMASYGVDFDVTSLQTPGAWAGNPLPIVANTGYSYFQRFSLFDEIYNNMTFVNSPIFGRNINNITPLFSNNLLTA
ncbi:MAG: hypothetical protein WAT79_11445, partial [Saprospiraceae bacterium]